MEEYRRIYDRIKENWDHVAKPLDSLGIFEHVICRLGAIQGTERPAAGKCCALIFCSDNGIVEEGVSQVGSEVTAICAENIAAGKSAVGVMASAQGIDVVAVDVGMACTEEVPGVLNMKVTHGTRNFLKESAMTGSQLDQAIHCGEECIRQLKEKGYDLVCIGEMGIGNTTTTSAVTAGILGLDAMSVTGRGAGLDDRGLERKRAVVSEAIRKYSLHEKNPYEVVCSVGGYDIAAMAGAILGGKKYGVPVVVDGAISLASLLLADHLDGDARNFVIASHKGREPVIGIILEKMNLDAVIDGDLALGEGTGAVMMVGLIRTALQVYDRCVPFAKSGVEQYKRFK